MEGVKYFRYRETWPWGYDIRLIANDGRSHIRIVVDNDAPGVAVICDFCVHNSARKRGRGTDIFQRAMTEIKALPAVCQVSLGVKCEGWLYNWYRRLGFEYHHRFCDGLMMMDKSLR